MRWVEVVMSVVVGVVVGVVVRVVVGVVVLMMPPLHPQTWRPAGGRNVTQGFCRCLLLPRPPLPALVWPSRTPRSICKRV